ncbi:Beta-13-galactosyl-O-glycosyl-glycoprotein beta-16-N-acetylglucosaminyltransferase [Taenia solium]|eukprot:TsM_000534600 transcript=TsM_000534600 gene=TsM_000534600
MLGALAGLPALLYQDFRCQKGDMADPFRILLRVFLAVLTLGSLTLLLYYVLQVPFGGYASLMIAFSSADIGEYRKDVALVFFSSINSPQHRNCHSYRDRFPIKQDRDGDMDIAVTIAVKDDVRPVARILRMIHRVNNYYCIHLDRNADSTLREAVQGLITCFNGNVELIPKNSSITVASGGASSLKTHLVCAEQALNRNTKWKYLINIDDDEFPLRTNLEIVAILQALGGSNLVEAFSVTSSNSKEKNKDLPLNAAWYHGALHGAYRREFLENALQGQFVAPLRQYLLSNQSLVNPEELFFPTLAYNAKLLLPGACQKAPSPAAEVNFGFLADLRIRDNYGVRCTTKYVDHVCLLGDEHVQMLKGASHLFASKFQVDYEPEAYTNLEQWYFDRIKAESEVNLTLRSAFDTYIYSRLTCTQQHI